MTLKVHLFEQLPVRALALPRGGIHCAGIDTVLNRHRAGIDTVLESRRRDDHSPQG
jgi:hypothetical protein